MQSPVAFFIFNRPECTAGVLEAIAAAKPPTLFVIADGPRSGHPADRRLVAETRAVIDRVDWPCDVRTCYSEENMGCGPRVASGLDWVFGSVPEAIVLEDDCVPHPTFFPYCEQLLERYRDDERIHMISGSSSAAHDDPYSYRFSQGYSIWGWASWARAWSHYDYEMRDWPRLRETGWLMEHLGDEGAAALARTWFDRTYADPAAQWDFQWLFCGWLREAVAVTPHVNLVTNIGFGADGTHHRDANHPYAAVPARPIEFPLSHPPRVEVVDSAERAMWDVMVARFMSTQPSGLRRLGAGLAGRSRRLRDFLRARCGAFRQ